MMNRRDGSGSIDERRSDMSQMKTPSKTDPRPVQSLALPVFDRLSPGPLHTILLDDDGSIFFSDEFNDAVVSLDNRGSIRWVVGLRKPGVREFRYPRGISIGVIHAEGIAQRCIGVADAWNHRVRFLSLDGRALALWDRRGQDPFLEPTDIRYISRPDFSPDAGPRGFWLVLDKGAHCIIAFGEDGRFLFQMGRGVVQAATQRWAIPGVGLELDPLPQGTVMNFPPFDFLYYPTQVLGNSENELYVWEPSSQSLKRLLYGNLLPVFSSATDTVEWIAVDVSGFLGWSRRTKRLQRFDCAGKGYQEFSIEGTPVSSNLPANQFWTQTNNELQRWSWEIENAHADISGEPPRRDSVLLCAAEQEILRTDDDEVTSAVSEVLNNIQAGVLLADEFLGGVQQSQSDLEKFTHLPESLQKLGKGLHSLEGRLYSALHHLCVGVLELRSLDSKEASDKAESVIQTARDRWQSLCKPLRQQFSDVQQRLDDLFMLRLTLPDQPHADAGMLDRLEHSIRHLESYLEGIREWLYHWSGVVEASTDVVSLPSARYAEGTDFRATIEPGATLRRPLVHKYRQPGSFLREVGCISLAGYYEGAQPRPCCMAMSRDGQLLVGLYARDQVLWLDADGKLLCRIGKSGSNVGELKVPAGVAFDGENRVWVADHLNHRIQMFDLRRAHIQVIDSICLEPSLIRGPTGLCCLPDGSVLAADSGNQRIVRISSSGACELYFARPGPGQKEIRYPSALCADSHGNVWCADPLHHRVHKMDYSGNILQTIGGCGLGNGCLLRPASVAVFDDGMVVVSQNVLNGCLKLFSPGGKEAGKFFPDYKTGHLLAHEQHLLVTQWDRDCILVYERV